jgi:photosystem II stability/assembly factor-like uncharacterized protein
MRPFYLIAVIVVGGLLHAQQSTFTALGPLGGVVTHLTGSLSDDVTFAVVKDNGLYRSTDGGESWRIVPSPNNIFQQLTIGQITVHPTNSNVVLMTTSMGLFTSNDKGATWSMPSTSPSPTHSVKFVPSNPSILFGSDDGGVLRSTDGGKTWFPLKDNKYFGNRPIYNITVHPTDVSNIRLIVSTAFDDTTALFFSPNGGTTWTPFSRGLPQGAARHIYVVEIDTTGIGTFDFRAVIGTANGVYALQSNQLDSSWVTASTAGIPTFDVVTSGVLVHDRFDSTAGELKFSFFLASNPAEYSGVPKQSTVRNGLFRIESKSNSIIPVNPGPFNQPVITRVFSGLTDVTSVFSPYKKSKGKIYIGTTSGVFVSADTGATWQQKNTGIHQVPIRNLVSFQQNALNKQLFAGIFGGGVVRSNDDGKTWSAVNIGLGNAYVTSLASDRKRNILYAGTAYTVYRSTNLGATWNSLFTVDSSVVVNPKQFRTGGNDMTIRVSERNPDLIFMRSKAFGLRRSTNGGISWSFVTPPVPDDTLHVPENFEFDPTDSLTIYYSGYGLYRSTDLGNSWLNISGNLPKSTKASAATAPLPILTLSPTINPLNSREILLPSVFDVQSGIPYRIFKTTDGGAFWDTLPMPAYDALYDPFDDRKVLASGPYGVFGSEDGGNNWKKFSDTAKSIPFMMLTSHAADRNTTFIGSENGAYKLTFTGNPKLSAGAAVTDFGSVLLGKDSLRYVTLSNVSGTSKAVIKFLSLTDSLSFRYPGPRFIEILPGEEVTVPVRFIAQTAGAHTSTLSFQTNDPLLPLLTVVLTGNTFTRSVFEKLVVDFGTVTVGKDSVLNIPIDNKESTASITLTFVKQSGDTAAFVFGSPSVIKVDSGKSGSFSVRFSPRSIGERTVYYRFTTNDIRFPLIQFRLKGVGVAKNFLSRTMLMDSSVGFVATDGSPIAEYYKLLTLSLKRSDIGVHYQKSMPFAAYNTLLYVQPNGPPPAELIDSLQQYVGNGGTIVIAGNADAQKNLQLNTFLSDTGWVKKFKTKTGLKLGTDLLSDTSFTGTVLEGAVIARPVSRHIYMNNVDSIITYLPGSIVMDTSVRNAEKLLVTTSSSLISVEEVDTVRSKVSGSVIAALSKVGRGRIVLISDYDIWWNGIPEDTTRPLGLFGGKNLQLAVNIFGLIDDYVALLEPTPQEAYEMISIPYAFSDSSVDALFKDLGKPNKLLWRMFGKYDAKKGYAEYPEDFRTVKRGEAYWLIAKNPVNMNLGTTTMQGTEEDFEITLHSGYNMVGNPFPYRVSWQNSTLPDSVENVLWSYHAGKYDSTTVVMEPFQGYWVKNRGRLPKTIRISSLQMNTPVIVPKVQNSFSELASEEWKIRLSARSSSSADEQNFVGVVRGAVDGLDRFDFSEPPVSPDGYVSIAVRHQEGRLAADYRSAAVDGYTWDIELMSSEPNIPISIGMEQFGTFDPSFKIYLLDNKQERVYDMTGLMEYSLKLGKNESFRSFRLIVGGSDFVEKNTNGIPLVPLEYSVSQNFPNPFNPSTTITYSLSHSGVTSIEIFNILGQKIKTLVDQFQPIGRYSVQWDGRDDSHGSVASGVYYYRVRCNEFTAVKKMTFIK